MLGSRVRLVLVEVQLVEYLVGDHGLEEDHGLLVEVHPHVEEDLVVDGQEEASQRLRLEVVFV